MEQIVIIILVAGAIGGLIKSLMESNGHVVMPRIENVKDQNGNNIYYVHLGFLMNVLLGAGAATIAASTPEAAITAGMATAFTAEKIAEIGKAKITG